MHNTTSKRYASVTKIIALPIQVIVIITNESHTLLERRAFAFISALIWCPSNGKDKMLQTKSSNVTKCINARLKQVWMSVSLSLGRMEPTKSIHLWPIVTLRSYPHMSARAACCKQPKEIIAIFVIPTSSQYINPQLSEKIVCAICIQYPSSQMHQEKTKTNKST